MIDRRSFKCAAMVLLALLTVAAARAAAEDYPAKPVWLITPAPAGVGPDTIARIVADQLTRRWGRQVRVINRPGAGGLIGLRAAAAARADGYSLYMPLSSTFVALPETFAHLPLDLRRDLVPIALIGEQPMVIAVNAKLGINSMQELVAFARKNPGKLNFGAGQGSLPNLVGELLQQRAKIKLTFVPYSNMAQAMQDAIGGTLQVYIESIAGLAGQIKAGTLRALAVASNRRLPDRPQLPTVSQALPDIGRFEARGWIVLVARRGTPAAILKKIAADVRAVLARPAVRKRLAALGTYVTPMSPAQLAHFIESEQALWRPIVRRGAVAAH